MRKKWKSKAAILLAVSLTALIAGCGNQSDGKIRIGVNQLVEHVALDAAKKGFVDDLTKNGYKEGENVEYDFQNAQGDMNTATTIAQKFAGDKVNMILAIATTSAQASAQATKDIPVVFTAVTDPVAAKIVTDMQKPGGNVTGTSDMNPIKEQLSLIKEVKPEAKKVGVLYNSGETNSVVQIEMVKKLAPELGLSIEERAVTNSSEVKQAAESLSGIDALYIPTDNTVVSALDSVLMVGEKLKIPVIAGEADSVKNGALLTYGIDYYKLGQQTGEMAVKILKGEAKPSDMAIETQKDLKLVVNKKAAARFNVELPQKLLDRADEVIE